MSETMGDRIPDALRRIGHWLGTDAAAKVNREFVADLMALHAAAEERETLRVENARLMEIVKRLQTAGEAEI